jgi:ParB/RepB/Spo0J family partition protein
MSELGQVRTETVALNKLVIPTDARVHDEAALAVLAASLQRDGQLQDVVVTPMRGAADGTYEVLAGVGRVLAARQLGWQAIRCFVRQTTTVFDKLRITFIENQDREDVSPIYQARLLARMMGDRGLNPQSLATEIGRSNDWVAEYMALLSLRSEVQDRLMRMPLTLSYLREIRRLKTAEAQIKAAERCIKEGLTRAQLRVLVREPKEDKVVWPPDPIAWVSGQIAIQRRLDPNAETVEHYLNWVSEALPKFMAEQPKQTSRRGRPSKTAATEQAAA